MKTPRNDTVDEWSSQSESRSENTTRSSIGVDVHIFRDIVCTSHPWSFRMAPMTPSTRGHPGPRLSPWFWRIWRTHSSCFCLMSAWRTLDSSFSGFNSSSWSLWREHRWLVRDQIHPFFSEIIRMSGHLVVWQQRLVFVGESGFNQWGDGLCAPFPHASVRMLTHLHQHNTRFISRATNTLRSEHFYKLSVMKSDTFNESQINTDTV